MASDVVQSTLGLQYRSLYQRTDDKQGDNACQPNANEPQNGF
ncbi:hypothetical protein ACQ90Y_001411 [Vibrio alginolyticus]|jgi:hypothetical protein